MRAAAADDDPRDLVAAAWATAAARLAIDVQKALVFAGRARGVAVRGKTRAAVDDAGAEHSADGAVEAADFRFVQAVSGAFGVKARQEQRFIDINVAEAGDEALIEQDAFQLAGATGQRRRQPGGGEAP